MKAQQIKPLNGNQQNIYKDQQQPQIEKNKNIMILKNDGASTHSLQSENYQLKEFSSENEELVYKINEIRFKNKEFIEYILSIIEKNNKKETKEIELPNINKTIHYHNEEIINRFKAYIQQHLITSQILQDFNYSNNLNNIFLELFSSVIAQNKGLQINLAQENGHDPITNKIQQDFGIQLYQQFPSEAYTGYFLEQVNLEYVNDVIAYLLIEEFVNLNLRYMNKKTEIEELAQSSLLQRPISQQSEDGQIRFEYSLNQISQELPFLSNNFQTIFSFVEQQINIETSQHNNSQNINQQDFISKQNADNSYINKSKQEDKISKQNKSKSQIQSQKDQQQQKFRNIYILLASESITEENYNEARMNLLKSEKYHTTTTENDFKITQQKKFREDKSIKQPPPKYNKQIITHRQIPINSIVKLVNIIDSDSDLKITKQDIVKFSHQNFIYLNDNVNSQQFFHIFKSQVYQEMFEECASYRNKGDKTSPLTISEIHSAVRLQQRKDLESGLWTEVARPFRHIWVLFLERIGELEETKINFESVNFQPIKYQAQQEVYQYHPNLNNSQKSLIVQVHYLKIIQTVFIRIEYKRPEAQIIVNNTQHIREINVDKESSEIGQQTQIAFHGNAFQTAINNKFQQEANEIKNMYNTISFTTQAYYDEALRLTKNPKLYITSHKNPISTFIPTRYIYPLCINY